MKDLFEHVKASVPLSEFVRTLPDTKGLTNQGGRRWRCNNVISGGDNTNAMVLDDESGYFKTFSHGQESGDVITLYSLTLGGGGDKSLRDAAVSLANHMGISIPAEMLEKGSYSPVSQMMEVMDKVAEITHDYLMNSEDDDAVTARDYLYERGATTAMIQEWKLGLIPSSVRQAVRFLSNAGDVSVLKKTKVVTEGRSGDFVPMAGRLTFPIMNTKGRCVSLSSRKIPGVDTPLEDSKYINTSNTPIYDKSMTLYGSHLLRKGVEQIIICEGNFDVIALNAMIGNDSVAVATCGTALTEGHVELIKKYKPGEVIVYFDGDDAGKESAAKSLWMVNHIPRTGIYSPDGDSQDPWDTFIDNGDVDITYTEPMPVTAARISSTIHDRDKCLDWFKESFRKLNFRDDRDQLIQAVSRYLGVKLRYLQDMTSDLAPANNRRDNDNGVSISPQVVSLIQALLTMSMAQRRQVGFSLYSRATSDRVMEICGVRTEDDEKALLAALGSRSDESISTTVFSLYPEPGTEDEYLRIASQSLARSLLTQWKREGIPSRMKEYVTAINMMSSGLSDADGLTQLDFILDVAASKS